MTAEGQPRPASQPSPATTSGAQADSAVAGPIRVLDDTTASRIAAGEVVERPASVVKELVENSLDAGATRIRVEIREGGRRWIQVEDDGAGIPASQARLAFRRHATSKIATSDDLFEIETLGFRGEALASIAAVSHLTMITRAQTETDGTRLRFRGGELVEEATTGAPAGTRVTVENLFHAVPARLKFLRTDATESARAVDAVTAQALAHPQVRFEMLKDGRTAFTTPGTGRLEDALPSALGADAAAEMLPIPSEIGDDFQVGGFVSPPHLHRGDRRYLLLFVNGRPVQDSRLSYAVSHAYRDLVPKGRFPYAVIELRVPPAAVDVNVHPAKTEVRFRDERRAFGAVVRAVRRTVDSLSPASPGFSPGRTWPSQTRDDLGTGARGRPVGRTGEAGTEYGAGQATGLAEMRLPGLGQRTDAPDESAQGEPAGRLPPLRPLGQVAATYIVAEGPGGLFLVDQHAAHERVLFEQLLARADAESPVSQPLLEPITLKLAPGSSGALDDLGGSLKALGFEVEAFGPDTVLVRAVPDLVTGADPGAMVREILEADPESGSGDAAADALRERREAAVARIVCKRASVKAGQRLSEAEMRGLIEALEACQSPRTCPHGRPTMLTMTTGELERAFGRH